MGHDTVKVMPIFSEPGSEILKFFSEISNTCEVIFSTDARMHLHGFLVSV